MKMDIEIEIEVEVKKGIEDLIIKTAIIEAEDTIEVVDMIKVEEDEVNALDGVEDEL